MGLGGVLTTSTEISPERRNPEWVTLGVLVEPSHGIDGGGDRGSRRREGSVRVSEVRSSFYRPNNTLIEVVFIA